MRTQRLLAVLLLAPLGFFATEARGDCAAPPSYIPAQDAGTVFLRAEYAGCTLTTPMLRQDVDSGTIVALAPYCVDAGDYGGDYEDDCVPAGTYRYGLETPLACMGCGGTAPFWQIVSVLPTLDAGCTRASGNATPTAYTAAPPWPADGGNSVCPNGTGGGCSTSGSVLSFDGLMLVLSLSLFGLRRRKS